MIDPAGASDEVVELVATDLGLPVKGRNFTPPARTRGRFTWGEHLRLALLELVYGHSIFEQVYEIEGDRARLSKLAWRPPLTIEKFDVARDGDEEVLLQWYRRMIVSARESNFGRNYGGMSRAERKGTAAPCCRADLSVGMMAAMETIESIIRRIVRGEVERALAAQEPPLPAAYLNGARLLTIDQVADRFQISKSTIYNLRCQTSPGSFAPAVKVGSRLLWRPGDVEAWIAEQGQ